MMAEVISAMCLRVGEQAGGPRGRRANGRAKMGDEGGGHHVMDWRVGEVRRV